MTTNPPRPKVIIFDLLTALLDSWSLWNKCAPTTQEGLTWRHRYLHLTYNSNTYVPYETLVAQAASDVDIPPSSAAALLSNWDSLAPWPGVPALLQRLKAKGYRLGVVTNCSVDLGRRAADICGQGVFDVVVVAEEVGFYKPRRECYDAVLEALGVDDAEDALFVAGSRADVPGAMAAGMRVFWHNRVGLESLGVEAEREGRDLGVLLGDLL